MTGWAVLIGIKCHLPIHAAQARASEYGIPVNSVMPSEFGHAALWAAQSSHVNDD
jgi:hypothetical protein